jgi:hypothetical protein
MICTRLGAPRGHHGEEQVTSEGSQHLSLRESHLETSRTLHKEAANESNAARKVTRYEIESISFQVTDYKDTYACYIQDDI